MTTRHITIAGIVLDAVTLKPLPGVKVHEKVSNQRQRTDANGFYSIRIDIGVNTPKMDLRLTLQKFSRHSKRDDFSRPGSCHDQILIDVLYPENVLNADEMLLSLPYQAPPNPGYEEAWRVMDTVIKTHEQTLRFYAMRKAHPEISLFYVATHGQHRLVFYRDGRVERYGGPGEPDFIEMEARYAPFPWHMVQSNSGNSKFHPFWPDISQRVQQDFAPTCGNAKAIAFPGDGRIIVINSSGEPEFFDMTDTYNHSPGRSAFEARFGKLPGYVPKAVRKPGRDYYEVSDPSDPNRILFMTANTSK